jgi:hypothetical protein
MAKRQCPLMHRKKSNDSNTNLSRGEFGKAEHSLSSGNSYFWRTASNQFQEQMGRFTNLAVLSASFSLTPRFSGVEERGEGVLTALAVFDRA